MRTRWCDGLKVGRYQDGFICSGCRCHCLRAADSRVQSARSDDRGRHVALADAVGADSNVNSDTDSGADADT
ncbi:MAG TPA: hypothetical protein VF337_09385, partial [Candidatus Limnocylindrales bacterium]